MITSLNKNGFIVGKIDSDRLNAAIAPQVKEELTQIFKTKGTKVILNLASIKFIDSTGIGTLISALKTARQNEGVFVLSDVQPDVLSLITLMKLDKIFDIYTNEDLVK